MNDKALSTEVAKKKIIITEGDQTKIIYVGEEELKVIVAQKAKEGTVWVRKQDYSHWQVRVRDITSEELKKLQMKFQDWSGEFITGHKHREGGIDYNIFERRVTRDFSGGDRRTEVLSKIYGYHKGFIWIPLPNWIPPKHELKDKPEKK